MDCKVYKCENNNGYGYCECINYITLDENGCCESMFVREEEDKDKGGEVMVTCRDCIHYDVCIFHIKGDENKKCLQFKNRSDVVEVVRCKDCVYRVEFDTNKFYCDFTGYSCGETGYCSDGTPKKEAVIPNVNP